MHQPTSPKRLALNLMSSERLGDGTFAALLDNAKLADEMGIDTLVLPDHVAIHEPSWKEREGFPHTLDAQWFEPLVALSAIASVTRTARLGTNVLIAPLRPATLLAKQIATLDAVSGGRVNATFGAGWQHQEFASGERSFTGRFDILEEQIQACKALWAGGPASFHGTHISFDDLHSYPVPPQGTNLPISLGVGLTERGLDRVLRLSDGWSPAPMPANELRDAIDRLREATAPGKHLTVTAAAPLPHETSRGGDPGVVHPLDEVPKLWEAGAETVIVHPLAFCETKADLEQFLASLLTLRDA